MIDLKAPFGCNGAGCPVSAVSELVMGYFIPMGPMGPMGLGKLILGGARRTFLHGSKMEISLECGSTDTSDAGEIR